MKLLNIISGLALAAGMTMTAPAAEPLRGAEPTVFRSEARQVSLLELYTSEGCSSCPPADLWLNRLKSSPGLWREFAPVAFHVDYWNSLGWRDPWSSPEYSERQRSYSQKWAKDSIYTPEFVLNGAEWRNWFGWRGAPSATGRNPGVLEVTSTNRIHWRAEFRPEGGTAPAGKFEVHAALMAGGLNSAVKAGENRGRTLPHEFAVVGLVSSGLIPTDGVARGTFVLDTAGHASEKEQAVTVWVTRSGELTPIQATGGWIRNEGR